MPAKKKIAPAKAKKPGVVTKKQGKKQAPKPTGREERFVSTDAPGVTVTFPKR